MLRSLWVAIWKKEGEYSPMFSVTCRRRCKDKTGDEWKDSYSYDTDDALRLSKLLNLVHTWILTQQQ